MPWWNYKLRSKSVKSTEIEEPATPSQTSNKKTTMMSTAMSEMYRQTLAYPTPAELQAQTIVRAKQREAERKAWEEEQRRQWRIPRGVQLDLTGPQPILRWNYFAPNGDSPVIMRQDLLPEAYRTASPEKLQELIRKMAEEFYESIQQGIPLEVLLMEDLL